MRNRDLAVKAETFVAYRARQKKFLRGNKRILTTNLQTKNARFLGAAVAQSGSGLDNSGENGSQPEIKLIFKRPESPRYSLKIKTD